MPRPKSELTATTQKRIGVRLTLWHYDEWKRLGGAKWLRQMLSESKKQRQENKG